MIAINLVQLQNKKNLCILAIRHYMYIYKLINKVHCVELSICSLINSLTLIGKLGEYIGIINEYLMSN